MDELFGGRLVLSTRCPWCVRLRDMVQSWSARRQNGTLPPAVPSSWGREVGSWLTNTICGQGLPMRHWTLKPSRVLPAVALGCQRQTSTRRCKAPRPVSVPGRASASFGSLGILGFLGSEQTRNQSTKAKTGFRVERVERVASRNPKEGRAIGIGTCVFLRGRVIPSIFFPFPLFRSLFDSLFPRPLARCCTPAFAFLMRASG